MRICNLWRNVSVLLVAGCICCVMPSCSDDDAPAVIEAAQPCASAYELNEVGDVALEFEVIPENAQVNEVKIIGENRAFEAQGFTSKGGGKWLLNARVTDFTQIKQENTVILSVRQTGGAASEVELVVTDPYTIENKFTLANPKGFNYYSADKENLYETGLPVVIAAEKQEEKKEEEKPGMDVEKKPEITYDDFAKLQFQIGEIVKCEAVPKSKKLLCSQVKIGTKTRQIVSGIKAHYSPEEMVGKKVMVVTNLKPAKLAGILSEGMILCAEDAEGNVCVVSPEKNMPAGSEIC